MEERNMKVVHGAYLQDVLLKTDEGLVVAMMGTPPNHIANYSME